MAILLHGTTLNRARRILAIGPDPAFIEPAGQTAVEGFSTCLQEGPFPFGTPQEYARSKAATFPDEGGPVILRLIVPDDIVALAIDERYFPLSQGLVQFDQGSGLDELRAAWQSLSKSIMSLEEP